ncbi:hypothetical protein [Pseudomonas tohonis]|uniref:Uncharacterized protein n=1 Tax=Pseudomonas tohonis TaxID=2725477 RepID=A0A6J4E1L6_9PSED|nr:hypothetical protein [Pseudomonas tohonis]UXY54255.1 hypothetical protein N9L84_06630 [Pseudomonas tohonis]BCG23245.1 hypothetical protein TUM18999_14360 [Pseudomonas tohonis]GJN55270.1 hypothetical protein TUM20286_50220 [Pseudomonas tohonis]
MTDPRNRGTSSPPPTLGEGCVRRYDPDELTDENGTDFPGAAELWERVRKEQPQPPGDEGDAP